MTKQSKFKQSYYLVIWPNQTISVLFAFDEIDLFWKLDEEGDPTCKSNKIYVLPEGFHIRTEFFQNEINAWDEDYELKQFKWSKNITDIAHNSLIKSFKK